MTLVLGPVAQTQGRKTPPVPVRSKLERQPAEPSGMVSAGGGSLNVTTVSR